MQWQFAHDHRSKDGAWTQVEQQDTTQAMAVGDWVLWSLTDNSAVSGIDTNTFGVRVTAVGEDLSIRTAGVVFTLPESVSTSTNLAVAGRVKVFTIQTWGFIAASKINVTANIAAPYPLCMSGTIAEARQIVAGDMAGANASAALCGLGLTAGVGATGIEQLNTFVKCI